jgi:hypothetical protein
MLHSACPILTININRVTIVTALKGTKILGSNDGLVDVVWKELCYGKTETLGDAEEVARWWRYN